MIAVRGIGCGSELAENSCALAANSRRAKRSTHRTADTMKIAAAVLLTLMQRNPEVEDSKRLLRCRGQCDMSVGIVIDERSSRVTPPRMNSRNREWPYPPMTMKSAETSAA